MERPTTRTFVLAPEGAEPKILEITWQGGEVEVALGRRGKAGRSSEYVFATVSERDAFITKRVKKAQHEGFVEAASGIIEPDLPEVGDRETQRLDALKAKYLGQTYLPETVIGEDVAAGSKFGGAPWLEANDEWPLCASCRLPMSFVMQLARADVPASVHWAFAADLIEVFTCTSMGRAGEPDWICQSDGSGRGPQITEVRQVATSSGPRPVLEALRPELLDAYRRVQQAAAIAHCRRVGDEATAAKLTARMEAMPPVSDADYRVPDSLATFLATKAFLFPVQRVRAWQAHDDVPSYEDPLTGEEVQDLEEHFELRCRHGDKLGGFPAWHQSPVRLRCKCGSAMRLLCQVGSGQRTPAHFGGSGTAYLHVCPTCHAAALPWQR